MLLVTAWLQQLKWNAQRSCFRTLQFCVSKWHFCTLNVIISMIRGTLCEVVYINPLLPPFKFILLHSRGGWHGPPCPLAIPEKPYSDQFSWQNFAAAAKTSTRPKSITRGGSRISFRGGANEFVRSRTSQMVSQIKKNLSVLHGLGIDEYNICIVTQRVLIRNFPLSFEFDRAFAPAALSLWKRRPKAIQKSEPS